MKRSERSRKGSERSRRGIGNAVTKAVPKAVPKAVAKVVAKAAHLDHTSWDAAVLTGQDLKNPTDLL